MASLLALALASSVGGFLLHLLNPPGALKTATGPDAGSHDERPPPADATPAPLPAPAPMATALPAPAPVPAPVPTVTPAPMPVFPAATEDPSSAPFVPPSRIARQTVRRAAPQPSWDRHPFAAAGKLAVFVAALGATGAVAVAAGIALLARSLR